MHPSIFVPCLALVAPVASAGGAVAGAALAPSAEGLGPSLERARAHLGAANVQQALVQRFAERVARLTPYAIDSSTSKPREGALIAQLAVTSVGASLAEVRLVGRDYASLPLRVLASGRMRLVRAADGATVLSRDYSVGRYARRLEEYQEDGAALLRVVAGAVDELAALMVDDAFLLRGDLVSTAGTGPAVTAVAPLPGGLCMSVAFDCWAMTRVPTLDTRSPVFRWKPFPQPGGARNVVYDLWIFGGDDDRVVEGLRATEHALDRPLAPCLRYSWAVRARFDTDAGPRALEWSSAAPFHRSAFGPDVRPTFGAPFITPCP